MIKFNTPVRRFQLPQQQPVQKAELPPAIFQIVSRPIGSRTAEDEGKLQNAIRAGLITCAHVFGPASNQALANWLACTDKPTYDRFRTEAETKGLRPKSNRPVSSEAETPAPEAEKPQPSEERTYARVYEERQQIADRLAALDRELAEMARLNHDIQLLK